MIKRLILIRHGETSSNKADPTRKLTERGIFQIQKSASRISELIRPNTVILSGNTNRTLQSTRILSKLLNITTITNRPSLQINKFSKFLNNSADPIKSYVEASQLNILPKGVETISQALNRFEKVASPLIKNNSCLIIVGHGGFLDIIIKFHPWFENRPHSSWLQYGQVKYTDIKSDRI